MTILTHADLSQGYVYLWTNQLDGMMYLGSHNGKNPKYIGSGTRFRRAFKKYGRENFKREILYVGPSFAQVEDEMLKVLDVAGSLNFYNSINAYSSAPGQSNAEANAARSRAQTGKRQSEESCRRMSVQITLSKTENNHRNGLHTFTREGCSLCPAYDLGLVLSQVKETCIELVSASPGCTTTYLYKPLRMPRDVVKQCVVELVSEGILIQSKGYLSVVS